MLCSIVVDEANPQGLRHQHEECGTLLRQCECNQDYIQPSTTLEDQAHPDSSSFSLGPCPQGQYPHRLSEDW